MAIRPPLVIVLLSTNGTNPSAKTRSLLCFDISYQTRNSLTTIRHHPQSLSLPRKKHNLSFKLASTQIYDRFGTKLLFVWYYVTKSLFLFTLFVILFTISYLSMTSTIRYLIS